MSNRLRRYFRVVDSQDSDSALGLSLAASTESVRSSILESVEENGRTYHKYKAGSMTSSKSVAEASV
ncbi:hypothetical protein CJF30_00000242 [Rutstroemia sp. NJR-2017a BBW]|nr:hypothetical protein CJF30_00000242 [Rutstroemia sp. NJR-2017a BBW]